MFIFVLVIPLSLVLKVGVSALRGAEGTCNQTGNYPTTNCNSFYSCAENDKSTLITMLKPKECPSDKHFDRFQRQCIRKNEVNCELCHDPNKYYEDLTSKEHFFACGMTNGLAIRYKCNKGSFNVLVKSCGGSKLNLPVDARVDMPKDMSLFVRAYKEKVNTITPVGRKLNCSDHAIVWVSCLNFIICALVCSGVLG